MHDVLIIGQGIAGSVLALKLLERGRSVHVVDNSHASACSVIAAGVINPITGRRLVRTWKAKELIPQAVAFYNDAESTLEVDVIRECVMIRSFASEEIRKQWMLRAGDPLYAPYFTDTDECTLPACIDIPDYGCMRGACHVDLPRFIRAMTSHLDRQGLLHQEEFLHSDLDLSPSGVIYRGREYRHIIFCEGHRMRTNPFFSWLPAETAKGEALICRIPGLRLNDIVKSSATIVHLEHDLFWVGSTYDWVDTRSGPTPRGLKTLKQKLEAVLKCPYEIVQHNAAIRPTAQDRRPFVGRHPEHAQVCILNGLGTKGASLAPYCAGLLLNHLYDDAPLPQEVDIFRHWSR
jgi:glycine oxidase